MCVCGGGGGGGVISIISNVIYVNVVKCLVVITEWTVRNLRLGIRKIICNNKSVH